MNQPKKAAFIFPGQGAQTVGMGLDLYRQFGSARKIFKLADERLGFALSKLIFEGSDDELTQTINAQPAMVTVSLACLEAAREVGIDALYKPSYMAGHSLGEYTSLAAAGVLRPTDTIYLARERGRLMHRAGQQNPGGMAAIIGLGEDDVSRICITCGCYMANINCPGQLVISGDNDRLAKASALAENKGARRVIRLQVSGAFHTPLMQPAVDGMTKVIAGLSFNDPRVPIVANTSARVLTSAAQVQEELLYQLSHGVKWQQSIELMIDSGVTTFVEIGVGRVLSRLIKRLDKQVSTVNISDVESVKGLLKSQAF